MKRIMKYIIFTVGLLSCIMITASVYASSGYVAVHTNYNWPVEKRTAGGTVFESSNYTANGYTLRAARNGRQVQK